MQEPASPAPSGLELVEGYLASVPAWYLATADVPAAGAGPQPHVRPFSFAEVEDGRLWLCTANTKDVYRELVANPRLELTAWKPGSGWIVLRGAADFARNPSAGLRERACAHLVGLGESYDGPDDPRLAPFAVADAEAWVCDIDGAWEPILP